MATIVLPGKKQVTVEGQPTLADLKRQKLVPEACQLVRKDAVKVLPSAPVVQALPSEEKN